MSFHFLFIFVQPYYFSESRAQFRFREIYRRGSIFQSNFLVGAFFRGRRDSFHKVRFLVSKGHFSGSSFSGDNFYGRLQEKFFKADFLMSLVRIVRFSSMSFRGTYFPWGYTEEAVRQFFYEVIFRVAIFWVAVFLE